MSTDRTRPAPRVSVIIPTFNRAHFLGDAISSVIQQTFGDWELIVVDDGSTDNTRALVEGFREARVRYFNQENRGISAAMNTGLKAVRGEYVARLDSDDIWLPEKLALQVAILETRPDIGLVYGRAQAMDAEMNLLPPVWGMRAKYPDDAFRSMLTHDFTCNITVMARRECFERVGGFDPTLHTGEDWDMWLRVSQYYAFYFLERIVARFRLHEGSITHEQSPMMPRMLDERIRVLEKIYTGPDLTPEIVAYKPQAFFNSYMWTARCWWSLGFRGKGWEHMRLAVRHGPKPWGPLMVMAAFGKWKVEPLRLAVGRRLREVKLC